MQHDNLDDRVAICLKIIRINKINNNYKGAKKMNRKEQIEILQKDWQDNPRWSNVKRTIALKTLYVYVVQFNPNVPMLIMVQKSFGT